MNLGEVIVRELGLERSNDTLSRWMAHHVASLLAAAQDAERRGRSDESEVAAERCRKAILELWQHRSDWPHGWPPPRAIKISRLLDELPEPGVPSWRRGSLLSYLQEAHYRLIGALLDLSTPESEARIEQQWLDRFGEILSPEETAFLVRVAGTERRLYRLQDLLTQDDEAEGDDSEADERHPALILANAYRDAVHAVVVEAARADGGDAPADDSATHKELVKDREQQEEIRSRQVDVVLEASVPPEESPRESFFDSLGQVTQQGESPPEC